MQFLAREIKGNNLSNLDRDKLKDRFQIYLTELINTSEFMYLDTDQQRKILNNAYLIGGI